MILKLLALSNAQGLGKSYNQVPATWTFSTNMHQGRPGWIVRVGIE